MEKKEDKNTEENPKNPENSKKNVEKKVADNKDKDVHEPKGQSTAEETKDDGKKAKKILRFQLPEPTVSEESFTSALSAHVSDPTERVPEPSFLKKYILVPLRRNRPRSALMTPCISKEELELENIKLPNTICLANTSSSKQLFEVLRNSASQSEADIKLINSTYLRKLEIMKEAINSGANVNTFRDRQTPLMIATDLGDERSVRYLLTVPKVNPDFPNLFGQSPLLVAVKNSCDKIALLLLRHNADVNLGDNMGKTPLHEALFQQRPHMVKLLLAFGAKHDKPDVFGEKPMYTASVRKPNLQCLKLLVKVGATPEYLNIYGMTLLTRAILNFTNFEIIENLITNGASVNSSDSNTGKTPLHFSALINDTEITRLLLRKGANVNAKTFNGITPYDEAILHKSIDVAQLLFPLTENANIKALHAIKNQRL